MQVQEYVQNVFSCLDKNNLKAELAEQYINTILEFVPKCASVIITLDIIDTFTQHKGIAYVSSATATGEGKAERAASLALNNINSFKKYKDCKILLLIFTGGESLGLLEINDAAQLIADDYGDDETILFTVVLDESMGSEMRVGIIGI
jgi:cell division GTPase FtsZ